MAINRQMDPLAHVTNIVIADVPTSTTTSTCMRKLLAKDKIVTLKNKGKYNCNSGKPAIVQHMVMIYVCANRKAINTAGHSRISTRHVRCV